MKTIKNMKPLSLLCVGYPGLCAAQFVDCASVLHVQPHHHLCGWYKMPWLVLALPTMLSQIYLNVKLNVSDQAKECIERPGEFLMSLQSELKMRG